MDDRRTAEPYSEAVEMSSDEVVAKLESTLGRSVPKGRRFRVLVEEIDDGYETWLRRKVEAGLRDVEAGRVVPHHDVQAWVRGWGTKSQKARPSAARRHSKSPGRKKR